MKMWRQLSNLYHEVIIFRFLDRYLDVKRASRRFEHFLNISKVKYIIQMLYPP